MTLAERPYPFPSRTRKSSSPAPKILRGQPFGKIGRRQDLVLSGSFRRRAFGYAVRDDHGRPRTDAPRRRLGPVGDAPRNGRTDVPRRLRWRCRRRPRQPRGCPFLVAEAGGWRLDAARRATIAARPSPRRPRSRPRSRPGSASRRRTRAAPPTLRPRSPARERLGAAPVRRSDALGPRPDDDRHRGSRGRPRAARSRRVLDRRRWPAIPAVLLVTTLFVLALSGFRGRRAGRRPWRPRARAATRQRRPRRARPTPRRDGHRHRAPRPRRRRHQAARPKPTTAPADADEALRRPFAPTRVQVGRHPERDRRAVRGDRRRRSWT